VLWACKPPVRKLDVSNNVLSYTGALEIAQVSRP
jgi:hypothetical protein